MSSDKYDLTTAVRGVKRGWGGCAVDDTYSSPRCELYLDFQKKLAIISEIFTGEELDVHRSKELQVLQDSLDRLEKQEAEQKVDWAEKKAKREEQEAVKSASLNVLSIWAMQQHDQLKVLHASLFEQDSDFDQSYVQKVWRELVEIRELIVECGKNGAMRGGDVLPLTHQPEGE